MSLGLFMDVHVRSEITKGLRVRGVDVITAQEDGSSELPDDRLLDRATELGRILFTMDKDFLVVAASLQSSGIPFGGVVYGHQRRVTIAQCISDLELIVNVMGVEELANQVTYLPVK